MALTPTYQFKTFQDIYTYVANELKVQINSTNDIERIKRAINVTYIDRICQQTTEWPWLRKQIDVPFRAYQTIPVTLTQNSTTIQFQTAPTESVAGYLFSAQGLNQRLLIRSHTAGSFTAYLDAPWVRASSASAYSDTGYVWTDKVILPPECREVLSVVRNNWPVPLIMVTNSEYDQLISASPANAYDPSNYTVFDYTDPSPYQTVSGLPSLVTSQSAGVIRTLTFAPTSGDSLLNYLQQGQRISINGSNDYRFNIDAIISSINATTLTYTGRERFTQAPTADSSLVLTAASIDSGDARYQSLSIFPNFLPQDKVLTVKYAEEIAPLINDTDEPRLALGDRIAIAYGALSIVWDSIGRNAEMAQKNEGWFKEKLSQMVARISATNDYPQLVPDKTYLARKRRPRNLRDWYWD